MAFVKTLILTTDSMTGELTLSFSRNDEPVMKLSLLELRSDSGHYQAALPVEIAVCVDTIYKQGFDDAKRQALSQINQVVVQANDQASATIKSQCAFSVAFHVNPIPAEAR